MTGPDDVPEMFRVIQRWPAGEPADTPGVHKVFDDPSGLRAFLTSLAVLILILGLVLWVGDFLVRVSNLKPASHLPMVAEFRDARAKTDRPIATGSVAPSRVLSGGACDTRNRGEASRQVYAYIPLADEKSRSAVRAGCGRIDAILYDALTLDADGAVRSRPLPEEADTLGDWLGAKPPDRTFMVLRPVAGLSDGDLDAMFADPDEAGRIAGRMIAGSVGASGICLNLANSGGVSAGAFATLVGAWQAMARSAGVETCIIAGARADFWGATEAIGKLDIIVLQSFEITEQPYPIAPRGYFDEIVAPLARTLPQQNLVLAPPAFGLNWRSDEREPRLLSFADAMLWADTYGADIDFGAEPGNARISYTDDRGTRNQIWFADSTWIRRQVDALPGLNGIAIWPLGYEDPAVRDIAVGSAPVPELQAMGATPIDLGNQVALVREGQFVLAAVAPQTGEKRLGAPPAAGTLPAVSYSPGPVPGRISAFGDAELGHLAMTFDGLPAEDEVAELLETLNRHGIRATFFASSDDLIEHHAVAEILRDAGHGFGTTLLSLEQRWPGSKTIRQMGLNLMQMHLATLTGARTAFVRESSGRLTEPVSAADFKVLRNLSDSGYVPVRQAMRPDESGIGDFADLVITRSVERGQRIIALAPRPFGDDRFGWLEDLVGTLGQQGFRFVGLAEMAGADMPLDAIPAEDQQRGRDGAAFSALQALHGKLAIIFIVMLSLDASRSFIYLGLAFLRRRHARFDSEFTPEVTVLVPAFNEEGVIGRCLKSLVSSDYPRLRIVVIDDGSEDRTVDIVTGEWENDPRITLLTEENQGKWHAENFALEFVRSPIFVGVDADTILAPNAISWLVQQFKDPEVGAVAGFVEVGNRRNFLTRCQALEYIVSQSVGRRAFEMFNGILVVPGAIGAWRTDAVRKAGLYSPSTITEDADLTVAVHRAGYQVRFEENARAYTEAPVKALALVKQRIRWALGMLQTSWKHRRSIRERRAVGVISIVDAIWISFLSSLFAPLVDILLIFLILQAINAVATSGLSAIDITTIIAILGYFSLIFIDMIVAACAFILDRRRDFYLVLLIPLMRFGYRQLVTFSALTALGRAITGRLYGWNKLARTGTVHVSEGELVLQR